VLWRIAAISVLLGCDSECRECATPCNFDDECTPGTFCIDGGCKVPICGDGLREGDEQCDEGAGNGDSAACTSRCKSGVCGDGVRWPAREECDDGNGRDDDVCTNACNLAVCGDGVLYGDEECDDGNHIEEDGCLEDCILPYCGDGVRRKDISDRDHPGFEECDDGTANSDTGASACRSDCRVAYCGDNVVDSDEHCDDGNQDDADQCRNTCLRARCGDGIQQPWEGCDDGNEYSHDACPSGPGALCQPAACGDGFVQTGVEHCDDGNAVTTDACVHCALARCGDGYVQAGLEDCDDGNQSLTDGCPDGPDGSCRVAACGDGFLRAEVEDCDGDIEGCTGCNSAPGYRCDAGVCQRLCGNGTLDVGEACDGGTGCLEDCSAAPGYQCDPKGCVTVCGDLVVAGAEECEVGGEGPCDPNCTRPRCGNAVVNPGEQCDDGNAVEGDACDSNCTPPACGNGVRAGSEACDDGNNVDGDGCTTTCGIESGWQCSSSGCFLPSYVVWDGAGTSLTVEHTAAGLRRLSIADERLVTTTWSPALDASAEELFDLSATSGAPMGARGGDVWAVLRGRFLVRGDEDVARVYQMPADKVGVAVDAQGVTFVVGEDSARAAVAGLAGNGPWWSYVYSALLGDNDFHVHGVSPAASGVWILGSNESNGAALHVDSQGGVTFARPFAATRLLIAVQELAAGDLLFSGTDASAGTSSLLRADRQGNVAWVRTTAQSGAGFRWLLERSDGRLVAAMQEHASGILSVALESTGEVVLARFLQGLAGVSAAAHAQEPAIFLAGRLGIQSAVIKLDSQLQTLACDGVQTWDVPVDFSAPGALVGDLLLRANEAGGVIALLASDASGATPLQQGGRGTCSPLGDH
jgi:cysteine-rich repeat protein